MKPSHALTIVLLLSGCATRRVVVLTEFEPQVEAGPLSGTRYYIEVRSVEDTMDTDLREAVRVTPPADGYQLDPLSSENEERWNELVRAAQQSRRYDQWTSVGWMRNGYGMHMADIYSSVPPVTWMEKSLAMEIEAKGGVVVDSPEEADVAILGEIKYLKIDIYMRYWADLVMDWQIQARDGTPVKHSWRSSAGDTAWWSTSWEYYQVLRDCGAQMMWLVVGELEDLQQKA